MRRDMTQLLALAGMVGPILFYLVLLLEGVTRSGYDARARFVGELSRGPLGWIQITSYVLFGVLMILFATAARRTMASSGGGRLGPNLLRAFGVFLIFDGYFVADPVTSKNVSAHGLFHVVATLLAVVVFCIACFVFANGFADNPRWARFRWYSISTGLVTLLVFFDANAATPTEGKSATGISTWAGAIERAYLGLICVWLVLLAFGVYRLAVEQARVVDEPEQRWKVPSPSS